MLSVESFFPSSHFLGPLRSILDMTTSSISEPSKGTTTGPQKEISTQGKMTSSQTKTSSPSKDDAAPPARRSRPTARRPRRIRVTRPEPGSLYDIMHDHQGASLYIMPYCWSDLHTKTLGVRFLQQPRITHPLPGPKLCGWDVVEPAKAANELATDLTNLLAREKTVRLTHKTQAIKAVMNTLFPATQLYVKSNVELSLYFADRVFQNCVRVPMLWTVLEDAGTSFDSAVTQKAASSLNLTSTSGPGSIEYTYNPAGPTAFTGGRPKFPPKPTTPARPLMAYINRQQLNAMRQNLFRVCSDPDDGDRKNTPIQNLHRLRSKQLAPANEDEDAHYISILLAMAQSHFYRNSLRYRRHEKPTQRFGGGRFIDYDPFQFSTVVVRLITHDDEAADFVVYQAEVSAVFLDRFAHPTKAPAENDEGGLDISYVHVPVWPILGLKERLAKALGQEIVGDLATMYFEDEADDLETYLTPDEMLYRERISHQRKSAPPNTPTTLSAKNAKKRRRPRHQSADKEKKQQRETLSEVVNSSFEDDVSTTSPWSSRESERDDDLPVLSPESKRRCTRPVGGTNSLGVC